MKILSPSAPCPCGAMHRRAALSYGACCARYLETTTPAPDAPHLMRSRYSAFVLEREAYLLATWHPSTRPARIDWEPGVRWLGLEVRRSALHDATHAEVEFVARQKSSTGPAVRLHECSRFVCEAGVWRYVDGDMR